VGQPETLARYEAPIDGVALDAAGNVCAIHAIDSLVTKRTLEGRRRMEGGAERVP
jgi:hypothetical protein